MPESRNQPRKRTGSEAKKDERGDKDWLPSSQHSFGPSPIAFEGSEPDSTPGPALTSTPEL
jgi:hypothetical protein